MSTILGPFISNDVGTETDHDNEDEQPNHEDHETRQTSGTRLHIKVWYRL